MQMKKIRIVLPNLLLVMLLCMPLLGGCYDRNELEEMAFIVSLGFDKGPGQTVDVTARIAVPRKLTGGGTGEGNSGKGGGEVGGAKAITVRAHSVEEAVNLLNTNVERRISMLHLAIIVFGEDLARDGILPYLRPLSRYREFRRTVFLHVVKGKARKIFDEDKPLLENTVTRYVEDLAEVSKHTGLSASVKLHPFITAIEAQDEDPFLGVLAINSSVLNQMEKSAKKQSASSDLQGNESGGEGAKQEAGKEIKIKGDNISYTPGQVRRQGGNPLEFIGTAVFRKDRMVTILDGIDSRMLLALRGEMRRTQMDFADPFEEGTYDTVEVKPSGPPKYEIQAFTQPLQVWIKVNLEGDLIGEMGTTDYTRPEKLARLESSIEGKMKKRMEHLLNELYHRYQTDPIALINHVRGQFHTYQEMKAYPWRDKLRTAVVHVDVDFKLRREGVQLAPPQAE